MEFKDKPVKAYVMVFAGSEREYCSGNLSYSGIN